MFSASGIADHYKVLGLKTNASAEDVKGAFRALAKKYHPDRNAGRPQWATTRMKCVIEANRVLSSSVLRQIYDRKHTLHKKREEAQRLSKRRRNVDEIVLQAEEIVNGLLSGRKEEAIKTYEELQKKAGGFDLSGHLELRDWVDGKFLIAEYYQERGKHKKALALYEDLYHSGAAQQRYDHLAHEVRDRIVRIYRRDLAPSAPPDAAAKYYLSALRLESSRSQCAFLHKKIAECHLDMGDWQAACRQLQIALRLKPDLKGATKICQRLSFAPPTS